MGNSSASRIQILIDAKANTGGATRQATQDLEGLGSAVSGIGTAVKGVVALEALDKVLQVGGAVVEMTRVSAQATDMRVAFNDLARGAGESGDEILSAMQKASAGMVSNSDLVASANRAMLLGVADSGEELAQLLDVARVRGQAMGLSLTDAFSDVVTGIGRMSPLILDNLGIVTGGEKVFDDYAATLGRTADSLSDAEKKQALLNKVIADTQPLIAGTVAAGEDLMAPFERMDAAIKNAKETLGELFGPAVAATANLLADAVNKLMAEIERGQEAKLPENQVQDMAVAVDFYKGKIEELQARIESTSGVMQAAAASELAYNQNMLTGAQAVLDGAQAKIEDAQALTAQKEAAARAAAVMQEYGAAVGGSVFGLGEAKASIEEWNAAVGAASGVVQPWINDMMAAGESLDVVKEKLKESETEIKAIQSAQADALSGLFSAAGEQADVLGLDSVLAQVTPAVDAIKAEVANLVHQFLTTDMGAAEFGIRLAALGDEADNLAGDITAAGQETQQFNDALASSPAVMAGLAAAAAAAGIPIEELILKLGDARGALLDLISATAGIESRIISSAASVADIVGEDAAFAAAEAGIKRVRTRQEELAAQLANTQISTEKYNFEMELLTETGDDYAEGVRESQKETERFARTLESDAKKAANEAAQAFDDLKGKVSGVLDDALGDIAGVDLDNLFRSADSIESMFGTSGDVDIEDMFKKLGDVAAKGFDSQFFGDVKNKFPEQFKNAVDSSAARQVAGDIAGSFNLLPREDAIAENARRLADIAVNGFKDQDWLGEFAAEVPDIFKTLQEAGDPQAAAAQMLKDFQAGFKPELLDRDQLKDAVKDMILSDRAKDRLAEGIAEELALELGTSLPDALGAAREALGAVSGESGTFTAPEIDTGATEASAQSAGAVFGAALSTSISEAGTNAIAKLGETLRSEENLKQVGDSGAKAGKRWGDDFLKSVSENTPQALVDLLANLVFPLVQAKQAQQASLTGAKG